jgi:16S rRNA (adenine1518-N6/adenine1519-N6)-dimethyltransferase
MTPIADPAPVDVLLLEKMVQVAFSQRRKLLRHTLGAWLTERNFAGNFNVQRRAEEVSVQEYIDLALTLKASSKSY